LANVVNIVSGLVSPFRREPRGHETSSLHGTSEISLNDPGETVPVTEESINELNGGHARSESPAVGRGHQSGLNSGAPVDSGVIVSVGNKLLLQSVVVFVGVDEGGGHCAKVSETSRHLI